MLLDSHLVEKFHASHRQKLSGLLRAHGDGFTLGICMVEGEPVAIDLGEDLELAFATACGTYHKLDEAGMAELQAAIAGGAKARDYLIERQLISDAEADQVAQAVVEDSLTRAFRGPCENVEFRQGISPEQLAIGKSALKMRVGVEPLIRTCDQRVGEQQAVEAEVGGWQAVFSLSEGEHSSGQLSEYEKMVLNFIDGRSTVDEIATLCRDSSMNLGRVLRSLVAKKVINRVEQARSTGPRPAITGAGSGVRPAARPERATANMPPAPSPATASSAASMQPYRRIQPDSSGGRPIIMVGLIILLAIAVGTALLVVQYNSKQERLRKDETEIGQLITARSWRDAKELISRLRQAATNDLNAIRTIDGLESTVDAAITAERTKIAELIEEEDFLLAKARIAALPEEGDLGRRLREAEAEQRSSAASLAEEVRSRLSSGDIAGALAALDEVKGPRALPANAVLDTWRSDTLVIARSQTHPLQLRLAAVARLRQARPDAKLQAQLVGLDGELKGQVQELVKKLARLEEQAKAGAWEEVRAEIAGLRLGALGAGPEIEVQATRASEAADKSEAELQSVAKAALAALASGAGGDALQGPRGKLAAALQAYPSASRRESLERIEASIAACSAVGQRTAAQRSADATSLASQVPASEPELADALSKRAVALGEIEVQARASLDEARRFGRIGDWNAAVKALEDIVRHPNWQMTAVRAEAEQELDAARAKSARRTQLKEELRAALLRGDLAACEDTAREIGLAYLPLVVASTPNGAEVVKADGTVIGKTPLIHDVTADERVDLALQVRLPGYRPVTLKGTDAEGGWRMVARLERTSLLSKALGHPLTAKPAVVDGTLWLADRARIVSLAKPVANALKSVPMDVPLADPIAAPVAMAGGELLLATRERLALRIGATIERMPLPVATDHAPLAYRSPLVVDRDLLVIAGADGRLLAVQRGSTNLLWQGAPGAAFACAPLLVGESVLVARRDGRLERYRIEDGVVEGASAIGQPVLSAWPTADGLAGLTGSRAWTWNGQVAGEDLPEPCIGGGPGVAIGTFGKVLQRGEKGWSEVGRLDPRPQPGTAINALLWAGSAVVAHGSTLTVCGPTPFRLDAGSELLAPLEWNGNLVAVSLEGGIWVWAKQ